MTIFVDRATWGHPDPKHPGGNFLGVLRQPYLVEHHTPGQDPTTYDEALQELAQIYNSHVNGNGWQDIGYTFLVWDQYVFEGRGFGYSGAHAPGANSISIGVAFIMDGRFRSPTTTERQSYQWLVKTAQDSGYLSLNPTQTGHRDWVSTTCPGDLAYADLGTLLTPVPGQPTDPIVTARSPEMYEFSSRPGGIFGWHVGNVNYDGLGGAGAYDFGLCAKDDVVAVVNEAPELGTVTCSVVYPSGKQSVAGAASWGHPMKFPVEEAGFVTVLVEAKAYGRVRVVGRST